MAVFRDKDERDIRGWSGLIPGEVDGAPYAWQLTVSQYDGHATIEVHGEQYGEDHGAVALLLVDQLADLRAFLAIGRDEELSAEIAESVTRLERAESAEARVGELEKALRVIAGPEDRGPHIEVYRAAGGGYQGLQAIARAALESEPV